jgi:hypothetical protein
MRDRTFVEQTSTLADENSHSHYCKRDEKLEHRFDLLESRLISRFQVNKFPSCNCGTTISAKMDELEARLIQLLHRDSPQHHPNELSSKLDEINKHARVDMLNLQQKLERINAQHKTECELLRTELRQLKTSVQPHCSPPSADSTAHQLSSERPFSATVHNIRSLISVELQKQLVNAITKSDWPRFSGQGEYDHMDFVHWIDTAKRDSHVPDKVIVLKLLTILEGVALSWYKTMRMTVHNNVWSSWHEAICTKFGTTNWKRKKQYAFEQDCFVPGETPVAKWVTRQYKRLQAFDPSGSQESVNFCLLGLMSGEVEYAAKNAMPQSDADISCLINVLEEIVDKTRLGRGKPRAPLSNPPAPKTDLAKDKARKPLSEVECYACKKMGHTSRNCPAGVRAVAGDASVTNDPTDDGFIIGKDSSVPIGVVGAPGRNNLVKM